ncbi:MAG: tetratricopeptide repeat protein [Gammaproteobacteria bacterium]|nr:tetratricopeptide repeat protein [Gammaproteobacteria bacterium]
MHPGPSHWQLGPWRVRPAENRLLAEGLERVLEPRVMAALEVLLAAGTATVADEVLLARVWGGQIVSDASLYKVIGQLRKALGDEGRPYRFIERVNGKGYRLLLAPGVLAEAAPPEAQIAPEVPEPPPGASPARPRAKSVLVLAGLLATLLLLALAWRWLATETAAPPATALRPAGVPEAAWEAYLQGRWQWAQRSPEALTRAEAAFTDALAQAPDLALAYVGLCDSFHFRHLYGDWPLERVLARCEPLLREALRREPELGPALASFGLLAISRRQWDTAAAYLERARRASPDEATAWLWSGELERRRGRPAQALPYLREAARRDPLSALVKRSLAYAHLAAGDLPLARASLREALLLEPDYADRPADEVDILGLDVARARAFLAWAQRFPDRLSPTGGGRSVGTHVNLGLVRLSLSQPELADRALAAAEALEPEHPYVLFARAAWHQARGDSARALELLRRRAALQPGNPFLSLPVLLLDPPAGDEAGASLDRLYPDAAGMPFASLLERRPVLAIARLSLMPPAERRAQAGAVRAWTDRQHDFDGLLLPLLQLSGEQAEAERRLKTALAQGWLPFPGDDFHVPERNPQWQNLDPALWRALEANRQAARGP